MSRQALGKNPKAVATGLSEAITAEGRAPPYWGGDGFQGTFITPSARKPDRGRTVI